MTIDAEKLLLEEIRLSGNHHQIWLWNADVLSRSAEILVDRSRHASQRLTDLSFREPAPPPGETITRSASPEEVSALVESNTWKGALFLLATALECLLKALIIKSGEELVSEKGRLHERYKTHLLVSLADLAGINLSNDDNRLLDRLTSVLIWSGRYPIPKKWEHLRESKRGFSMSVGDFQDRSFDLYMRIRATVQ